MSEISLEVRVEAIEDELGIEHDPEPGLKETVEDLIWGPNDVESDDNGYVKVSYGGSADLSTDEVRFIRESDDVQIRNINEDYIRIEETE